jgi:hypothetical protein
MHTFSTQQSYYWYLEATDMRKSFNGLSGLVQNEMKQEPTNGSVFIFVNKRRNKMKLLVWDRNGFVIYYKSLEAGTFEIPQFNGTNQSQTIRWEELVMIIEGVELKSVNRKKRFEFAKNN